MVLVEPPTSRAPEDVQPPAFHLESELAAVIDDPPPVDVPEVWSVGGFSWLEAALGRSPEAYWQREAEMQLARLGIDAPAVDYRWVWARASVDRAARSSGGT